MRLDEAIKLQGELRSLLPEVGFNKYIASTNLGVEALKLLKELRSTDLRWFDPLLPGETEEGK